MQLYVQSSLGQRSGALPRVFSLLNMKHMIMIYLKVGYISEPEEGERPNIFLYRADI